MQSIIALSVDRDRWRRKIAPPYPRRSSGSLVVNPQFRQRLLEFLHPLVRHLCVVEVQLIELGQARQVHQGGIGNLGRSQVELFEMHLGGRTLRP